MKTEAAKEKYSLIQWKKVGGGKLCDVGMYSYVRLKFYKESGVYMQYVIIIFLNNKKRNGS